MAYADLLENENSIAQFLVVAKPRRIVSGFTLVSGAIYKVSFDYGNDVDLVTEDGVSLTEAASSSLSSGEWYYDVTNQELYVRTSTDANPSGFTIVATYIMTWATLDEQWYIDPLDSATTKVYYDPIVARSMSIDETMKDIYFGVVPSKSSSIVLINSDHELERHLYDSSFNNAPVQVYHLLKSVITDQPDVDNIKKVYNGFCSKVRDDNGTVTITVFNKINGFDDEYRNDDTSFFTVSDFSSIDQTKSGTPIPYVYGRVDGFNPVNIDYESDSPTTSTNRIFVVIGEQNNIANITKSVGGGVHTATRTYVTSAKGLMVGDDVHMDRAIGTDEYKTITDVNYVSNYIDHSALSGGAMADGDTVKRGFVTTVRIRQNDVIYQPMFGRDYSMTTLAAGTSGFTFINNFEANVSMPNPFSPNDTISCRVYGRTNDVTLGGPAFSSNDSESGNMTNPIAILLDLMKRVVGISEDEINSSSFTSAESSVQGSLGFSIPDGNDTSMPKVKDILKKMFQSVLFRLYLDSNQTWAISVTGPLGSSDYSLDETETIDAISHDFDYNDIASDIIVRYNRRQINETLNPNLGSSSKAVAISNVAKYLHEIDASFEIDSILFKEADAQILANKYVYALGDRRCTVNITTKTRLFPTTIGNIVELDREKLPGFSYTSGTSHQRSHDVVSVKKNLTRIDLELDDQKGIEDNSGSWGT